MTQNINFVAPAVSQEYICRSGNTYQSSAAGLIAVPLPANGTDVVDLLNAGCVSLGFSAQNVYLRKIGTVTVNGTSVIAVADPAYAITDVVNFSLNTVGGTVGTIPHLSTNTPGTGFSVVGVASDASKYNYQVWSAGPV